jgi:hypothetical protein
LSEENVYDTIKPRIISIIARIISALRIMKKLLRGNNMKSLKKSIILIALCVLLIIPQTGCGAKEPVSQEFFCLDTVCTITVYGQSQSKAEDVITDAVQLCEDYENMLSRTVSGSDVDRINNAGCKPVEVSDDTVVVSISSTPPYCLSSAKSELSFFIIASVRAVGPARKLSSPLYSL